MRPQRNTGKGRDRRRAETANIIPARPTVSETKQKTKRGMRALAVEVEMKGFLDFSSLEYVVEVVAMAEEEMRGRKEVGRGILEEITA